MRKKVPGIFVRWKSDSLVLKQYELFPHIKKYRDLRKDFYKLRTWWDFASEKNKIVIKMISPNYKVNNSIVQSMKKLGWNVLFINFNNTEEDISKLCEQIEFILSKKDYIETRAGELNDNLPKSERWFKAKIKQEWFYRKMGFEFNKPMFGTFIYDLYSENYRLCIEVDGSIHGTPTQEQKDLFKTNDTISKGFHIIRVQAYNDESYNKAVLLIEQLLGNHKSKTYKVEKQQDFNDTIERIAKSGKLPF